MSQHRSSYWKTSILAGALGLGVIAAGHLIAHAVQGVLHAAIIDVAWLAGIAALCVTIGGLVVLYRDHCQASNRPDIFRSLNQRRSEKVLELSETDAGLRWRRALRWLSGGKYLLVGDIVETRSYEEICATLDANGCLDGMPFLPEMRCFCGQRARVFRHVDKIYDYGRTKHLRRLRDSFLLTHLRCDGSAHGGCQAGCYLMWKTRWLKRIPRAAMNAGAEAVRTRTDSRSQLRSAATESVPADLQPERQYVCQFTQLASASTTMKPWDIRPDFRPLLAGNVTVAAFTVVLYTRLFNYVQHLRGGVGYPALTRGTLTKTPAVNHGLNTGDSVRVLSAGEIARTLDATGRNRGLWFDRDMLKHSGHSYEVLKRVDRIIDDATGRMRVMKTPCIVLKDVDYSGEFLRLCAQEEHLYWREAWLAPIAQNAEFADAPAAARLQNSSQ